MKKKKYPAKKSPVEKSPVERSPLLQKLEAATADLQMPSETDAPFRVFSLEGTPIEKEKLPALLELKHDQPIAERKLDNFFENAATIEDWMEDDEKAAAERFATLRDLLKAELKEACVYTFGDTQMDVVIIGQLEGGCAGAVTLIVET